MTHWQAAARRDAIAEQGQCGRRVVLPSTGKYLFPRVSSVSPGIDSMNLSWGRRPARSPDDVVLSGRRLWRCCSSNRAPRLSVRRPVSRVFLSVCGRPCPRVSLTLSLRLALFRPAWCRSHRLMGRFRSPMNNRTAQVQSRRVVRARKTDLQLASRTGQTLFFLLTDQACPHRRRGWTLT